MYYLIEYANLYVEKYTNGKLLLDFTVESEFIFFRNNGDYTENMKLWQYEPTMLYFRNINNLRIAEGDIVTISMQALINHKEKTNKLYFDNTEENEKTYNIFMSFNDGSWLEELFRTGDAIKNNRLRKHIIDNIVGTWPNGTPCSLNNISDQIKVEVVDVTQGSANLIHSNHSSTIFDFGASIFASKFELSNIVDDVAENLGDFQNTSLIISHWDSDHYNLLTVLDEHWLQQLCCVFFPSEVITLTAKQVVGRLLNNCLHIRTFKSPSAKKRGSVGIVSVISTPKYTLYVGEKSKDTNKSGLALAVKSSRDITIFGADHTNKQIWEYIYPHITAEYYNKLNVFVPHHGGSCGKINLICLSGNPGIASISVGKNTYKHPNQATIDSYDKLKFDVRRTDWERGNILIEMK